MMPEILSKFGFDSLFIKKLGHKSMELVINNSEFQFIWKGKSDNDKLFVQISDT
jgi:hypothetical protein